MSGLSRTPGKRVWVYPHRGFESRLLRQIELPRTLRGFFLELQTSAATTCFEIGADQLQLLDVGVALPGGSVAVIG